MSKQVVKKLSKNDLGLTGSHQAGILVPRVDEILNFFPILDRNKKNPRMRLTVRESSNGTRWEFNYIYYNNKFFGGTRNEYRLTGMTQYLRAIAAKVGDELCFSYNEDASVIIEHVREDSVSPTLSNGVLVLNDGWKIVGI